MKNTKKTWMVTLALALILSLSMSAFAETATEATENSAPAEEATTPVEDAVFADETQSSDEALIDALNAYAAARYNAMVQKRQDALKAELDGYVEAGSMTREQADLILNAETVRGTAPREARNGRNGSCDCMPKGNDTNGQPEEMPGNGGRNGRNNRNRRGLNHPAEQNDNYGMMPQFDNDGWMPYSGNNGMMPRFDNDGWMPYSDNNDRMPQYGNDGWMPQNGNDDWMPHSGNNSGRGHWSVPQNGSQGQSGMPNRGGHFNR
ncbi:MAG: hypothetical protein IJ088_05830 [Clostridia bacterium]|nr:hypothetical protein [Clostridia bacterium]